MNEIENNDVILNIINDILPNDKTVTPEVRNFTEECVEMIKLYAKKTMTMVIVSIMEWMLLVFLME